jgi:phosphoribosylformylglycinamidine synthase
VPPLPFVSGNVSLYNQSGDRAVPASPIVMCAGVLGRVADAVGLAVRRAGEFLVFVGEPRDSLSGSTWAREIQRSAATAPPALDLAREAGLQDLAVAAAEGRWVRAAHDVSDGGLLVALTEMLLAANPDRALGMDVDFGTLEADRLPALFSERPGIVFAVSPERTARLFQAARERSLLAWPIGSVAAHGLLRARMPEGDTVEWTRAELEAARDRALPRLWNEEKP